MTGPERPNREVPLFRRWASVSRDPSTGTVTIHSTHFSEGGAKAAVTVRNRSRKTWQSTPRLDLEPTDWGPRTRRLMRVVQVLSERGVATVTEVSRRTALSPRGVEQLLLELGRKGHAVCRQPAVVGEGGRVAVGLWRLVSTDEWAAEQHR